MARENQSLQIALIVFVILTLVLAGTTFLFYHQYDEAATRAKLEADKANTAQTAKSVADGQIKTLIGMITADQTLTVDKVQEQLFNADIKVFGQKYADEDHYYHPLVVTMQKAMDDKNGELDAAKKTNRDLDDKFKEREKAKDAQMKTLEEERQKAVSDRENEVAKFKTERTQLTEYQARLESQLKEMRKAAGVRVRELEESVAVLQKRIKELIEHVDQQAAIITQLTGHKIIGQPSGEVVQVDRGSGTVWINLGRADSLSQQVTFRVYPADLSDLKIEGNKGSIEVTHVLGDHLAEARVTDDKLADPILPGDKVYTPLWNPGQKRHFALAGFFNIDGRAGSQSDLHTVINLIKANRCTVDCYIEDNGEHKDEMVGKITANTNCLVLGIPPDDKADPRQILAFSQMRKTADHLRIPIMQFNDMLQEMGWRNGAPMIRYGGGNPNDFQARPDPNRPPKSAGSSAFPERQPSNSNSPPAGSNGSSYIHY
jgi:hypothetical protein